MAFPGQVTYKAEIAFGSSLEGLFRIGESTVGGTDVISGWPADLGYTNVTDDLVSFSIRRGRSNDQAQLMAGSYSFRLRDQSGKYNPANTSSSLSPDVVPFKVVRLTATFSGTDYPLFYGFITNISNNADPDSAITSFQCSDLFAWLTLRRPTISATGSTNTGGAIGVVLDAIEWPVSLRDLDTGDTISDFSADGTKTCMALIKELLDSELGHFFIAGDGKATFKDRNSRYASTTSLSTIDGADDTLMSFKSTNSVSTIFNAATFTRSGGSAQTSTDTTSINLYGRRDANAVTTSYLPTDAAALSRAATKVTRLKDPKTPATATLISSLSTSADMLARDFGDRVTITEAFQNTSAVQYFVESVAHSAAASRGVQRHVTTWRLSEAPGAAGSPVIIDVTGIGSYIE
jgi:hypothetical protein